MRTCSRIASRASTPFCRAGAYPPAHSKRCNFPCVDGAQSPVRTFASAPSCRAGTAACGPGQPLEGPVIHCIAPVQKETIASAHSCRAGACPSAHCKRCNFPCVDCAQSPVTTFASAPSCRAGAFPFVHSSRSNFPCLDGAHSQKRIQTCLRTASP